jgi:hypothetical protein
MDPLVITNWHCLHDIVDRARSAASQSRTSLKLRTDVGVLESRTTPTRKSCSYDAPGWKILIGVRTGEGREDVRWCYVGTTLVESPMREFVVAPGQNGEVEESDRSERSGGMQQRGGGVT